MVETTISRPRVLLSAGMIQQGQSGVGRYVVELAQRLADMEEIDLYVAGLEQDRHLFGAIDAAHWWGIPSRCRGGVMNLLWHQLCLPRLLRRESFDLLHIPSYRRIVGWSPVAQLATVHDCAPFRMKAKYGWLRGFFGRKLAPALARRCAHVLTVSEFTRQDLMRFYRLPRSKVEVVYNGLDHGRYRVLEADAVARFRQQQRLDQPYFLYLSRLEHPGKNHLGLIEAYEAFRRESSAVVQLVLGGAPWQGAEQILARVARSPYRADIRLSGFIAEVDLPLWYGAAQALVFPSLMEGFGLPVLEAMACGLRVASSNCGSLPEVAGEAALYFDPRSTSEMAGAMLQIQAESEAEAQQRIECGLLQAAKFDWEQSALATCQSYSKIINSALR